MTIKELYQWAQKRDIADLPLYVWDRDAFLEVEVSGQRHEAAEDEGLFSSCCGAPPAGETDLCSECKEHTGFEEGLPERVFLKS